MRRALDSGVMRWSRSSRPMLTALAAAALVLLPALAWLQYSWLDQIADADRERRTRTLQTAATQLAQDFDGELSKAVASLQIDAALVEQQAWSSYADRYQAWAETALVPGIVEAVYFVDAPLEGLKRSTAPVLRRWNLATGSFEVTTWPEALAGLRALSTDGTGLFGGAAGDVSSLRGRGGVTLLTSGIFDEHTILLPLRRISTPGALTSSAPLSPPGFTIIRLSHTALRNDLLPALVRRHVADDRGTGDYFVAVVSRADPNRIIYESALGAAKAALSSPEASTSLLTPHFRSLLFMARTHLDQLSKANVVVNVIQARRADTGAIVQGRVVNASDGHWRLVIKHRGGVLEAAVASARTRNLALSFGILLLLTGAIGLIVVSARRADRLARQQLDFVAAVSHELRTPVSVISAAAENLADGLVDEHARVQKYGETIQVEARRLAETVERVLQMAGIASGRTAIARAPISPSALVQDAVAASRHDIDQAKATVEVDVAPDLPTVVGDQTTLRVAIQNLIGNAVKYGGTSPWVRVSATPKDGGVRIAVEDRGLGIESDDLAHIFEPFYRGRVALSRQIQGSGLGLHLARRVVESHAGSISVQSEPGRGSTFTIDLPLRSERG